MRVERAVLRHVRVRLRRKFRTARTERGESDSVVVELVTDAPVHRGYGEGVPRDYLTGETPATCFDFLREVIPPLLGKSFEDFSEVVEFASELPFGDDPLRPRCAARSALEVALLDAAGRCFDVPLVRLLESLPDLDVISQRRDEVRYGVVVSAGAGVLSAYKYRLYGFRDVKLKLGVDPDRDVEFVTRMRRRLGPRIDVRVDANGAWSLKDALKVMRRLRGLDVSFVEQPLARGDEMRLTELREKTRLPVMLDESLVSERDAQLAVDGKLCDAFNLRVSKNGGIIPVLRLAKLAAQNGIGVQLGCHPGETGILSAAGRAIACSVRDLRYLEGSYDRHIHRRSVIREDITFGRGGRAPCLAGAGLGVTVGPADLDALTVAVLNVQ